MVTSLESIAEQFRALKTETSFDPVRVDGTDGNDVLFVSETDRIIDGHGGNDTIYQGPGPLGYVYGGLGNDTIYGAASGGGSVYGEGGDDLLYSRSGATWLQGQAGSDRFVGSTGNDLLMGNSVGYVQFGYYYYPSEAGFDVADYRAVTSGIIADLTVPVPPSGPDPVTAYVGVASGAGIGQDYLIGIDALWLGSGSDNVTGSYLAEEFRGYGGNDTIAGAGGNDTLFGGFGNDSLAGGTDNDTLWGEGDADTLSGGDGADVLDGAAGADVLNGDAGYDTLRGGADNDTYNLVGVTGGLYDLIVENANAGYDRVVVWTAPGLASGYTAVANVEEVSVSGSGAFDLVGNTLANLLTGNDDANVIQGGSGNDTVRGAAGADSLYGDAGNDRLEGGSGYDTVRGGTNDDTYVLDSTAPTVPGATTFVFDSVVELAGGGTDAVLVASGLYGSYDPESAIAYKATYYALPTEVEHGTVTGAETFHLAGNTLANTLTGNNATNTLTGGAGHDTLFGMAETDSLYGEEGNDSLVGGSGTDWLYGGNGNDTYVLDSTWSDAGGNNVRYYDNVVEAAGAGIDTVQVKRDISIVGIEDTDFWTSYTLSANIENGVILGTDAFSLVGNSLANTLTGNGSANTLSGDTGNDTLRGGAGVDALLGGIGNDRLDGGAGVDDLRGGADNDIYVLASTDPTTPSSSVYVFDAVTEVAGEGTDTILVTSGLYGGYDPSSGAFYKATSYTLGANIENGQVIGAETMALVGNTAVNRLQGNAAANSLSGLGGNDVLLGDAGVDTLAGGDGNDILIGGAGGDRLSGDLGLDALRYVSTAEGGDIVTGFVSGQDYLEISRAGFGGGLAGSSLTAGQFVANTTGLATGASNRFIFETDTKILWWDADGTGAGARVNLATLSGLTSLSSADIHLIA